MKTKNDKNILPRKCEKNEKIARNSWFFSTKRDIFVIFGYYEIFFCPGMRGHQKSYQKKFYDDSDFGCLEIKDFWPTVKTVVFIRRQFPHNILFEGIFRPIIEFWRFLLHHFTI